MIKRKTKGAVKLLAEAIESTKLKSYYRGIGCIYRAYAHMTNNAFEVFVTHATKYRTHLKIILKPIA